MNEKCNWSQIQLTYYECPSPGPSDEMQVPAECLASPCQKRAADLRVVFKTMPSLFLFLRYAEPQNDKKFSV